MAAELSYVVVMGAQAALLWSQGHVSVKSCVRKSSSLPLCSPSNIMWRTERFTSGQTSKIKLEICHSNHDKANKTKGRGINSK